MAKRAENYDVVVIGAGQAGLTMGYFLSRQKRRYLIVERSGSVGSAWRERWDSLTLFTSRRTTAFPDSTFRATRGLSPNRDEVIDIPRGVRPPLRVYPSASTPTFGGSVRPLADSSSRPIEERLPAQTKLSSPPGRSSSLRPE